MLASWRRGQDCCQWKGVTCSNRSVHVVKLDLYSSLSADTSYLVGQISPSLLSLEHLAYLDLSFNFLTGPNYSFPDFIGSMKNLRLLRLSYMPFTGGLPSSLGNLSHLEYLELSMNFGFEPNLIIPESLSAMKNLRHLDLSGTLFTGRLPSYLGNLSNLEYLNLAGTSFSGSVPPQLGNLSNLQYLSLCGSDTLDQIMYAPDISWLAHLHSLEYLAMYFVNLSTSVDWAHVLNTVPSLESIFLFNCLLPSANQSLMHLNLTNLRQLDLSLNHFDHPVESCWFWNLTNMEKLYLRATNLYGQFPTALGRMTGLQLLYFDGNGNTALMQVDLKDLCALERLSLAGSLSAGNITELVEKLPRCSSNKLQYLSLGGNNMTGILPDRLSHLTGLELDLSYNSITGVLPPGIGNLFTLDLSYNQISGMLPANMSTMQLRELYLNSNNLTGQIPQLPSGLLKLDISQNSLSGPLPLDFGAQNITELICSSNYFTGHIPESICDLQYMLVLDLSNNYLVGELPRCTRITNMAFLLLSNNNLSGELPLWVRSCSSLAFMDLAWNKFSGKLPAWIGDLVYLRFLQLSHNKFFGDIPVTITKLKRLRHLSLADNAISGTVPLSLLSLTAMTHKHPKKPGIDMSIWYSDRIGKFSDVLSVVLKHQELKYGAGIFQMVGIDLSLNHLTGEIPYEITSLNGLLNLNLSWNQLSGLIPEKIGAMKSIESLDLSWNNLSGEIPPSLSELTYLSYMDLSHNNLTGRIPQGRQLDTLYTQNPSMYDGNSGLCGPPLRRNCSGNNTPENTNQTTSERDPDPLFFYLGLGSGYIAGLWVVFCAPLSKKVWRIAYFRLSDEVYDKVYVHAIVTWGRMTRRTSAD